VLAARNGTELAEAVEEIRKQGGRAVHITADVADPNQVETIAEAAMRAFGRIDTWVNNATVSMYGRLTELAIEDMQRQMNVSFWGQVYGARTAAKQMRHRGGAIINVGSALSDRAIPLQGIYCAATHALKAFTDTLRMELEDEGAPISVTLVKPASIDTPFFEKARTYLGAEPQPVPLVYAPDVVAGVIIHAAQHPLRELIAGGAGAKLSTARFAPRLADKYMEHWTFDPQKTETPVAPARRRNLHATLATEGGERGHNWRGHTRKTGVYTKAMLRPATAAGIAAATVALAGAAWRFYGNRRRPAANPTELGFGLS
jgi:short-subunit dehydrogenase